MTPPIDEPTAETWADAWAAVFASIIEKQEGRDREEDEPELDQKG